LLVAVCCEQDPPGESTTGSPEVAFGAGGERAGAVYCQVVSIGSCSCSSLSAAGRTRPTKRPKIDDRLSRGCLGRCRRGQQPSVSAQRRRVSGCCSWRMRGLPPLSSLAMRLVHWEQQQLLLLRRLGDPASDRDKVWPRPPPADGPTKRRRWWRVSSTGNTLFAVQQQQTPASQPPRRDERNEDCAAFSCPHFRQRLISRAGSSALPCPALSGSFVRSLDRSDPIRSTGNNQRTCVVVSHQRQQLGRSAGRSDPDTTRNGRITQAQVHAVGRLSVPSTCS
jgi:hypothetical protein